MLTSDFDYYLPPELIAQHPPEKRGTSRMLVLDRKSDDCELRKFSDIPDYLSEGDCIIVNNTRVLNSRFYGEKEETGAKIELLLTMPLNENATLWKSLVKPGKRVRSGTRIRLYGNPTDEISVGRDVNSLGTPSSSSGTKLEAEKMSPSSEMPGESQFVTIIRKNDDGSYNVKFDSDDIEYIQENYGHTPLPPYISREDEESDKERYQTVYATTPGAVAAPTAGLHFTDEIIADLAEKGVNTAEVTLHVGPGTFKPVSADDPRDHKMHSEIYSLSKENAELINQTRRKRGRILAIGTTSVRVLETCADEDGNVMSGSGSTDIFLYPPHETKSC